MQNSSLTPVQKRLLQMLGEVVALCESNGITYYAAGGTALGAVRHGGFIPWDDDVDLMMPRSDWRRFVELARMKMLPPDRELCCLELDENYPHVFGRYVDVTSCCVHYNQLLGGTPEGLCIDIFILDPVPDSGGGFDAHREALSLYNDMANELGYSYPMSSDLQLIGEHSRRIKREGRRKVLSELEADVARHDEGEYLVMRWACAPRLFHKSIFGFRRYERFENLSICVPARLNDYLVQHYGDTWPCLPPEGQRAVHDAFTFADVSYRKFQDDYLPFLNVERTRRAFLARRRYHVEHMDELRRAEDLEAKILACFACQETIRRAGEYEMRARVSADEPGEAHEPAPTGSERSAQWPALQAALAAGDHGALDFVFEEYYRVQGLPNMLGREEYLYIRRYYDPVIVELGDELVALALRNLVDTGRIALAVRVLAATERSHGALSPRMRSVLSQAEAVRLPASLADLGLGSEARRFASQLPAIMPTSLPASLAYLRHCVPGVAAEDSLESLATCEPNATGEYERVLSRALGLFPEDGELLKFRAESLLKASEFGDTRGAESLYETALGKTSNAFVVKEIEAILGRRGIGAESAAEASQDAASDSDTGAPSASGEYPQLAKWPAMRLLGELLQACSLEGIPCCIGPLSCAYALNPDLNCDCDGPAQLDLLVPSGYLLKLANALQKRDRGDRALDCWLTNPNHPSSSIDYVDATTTYLNLDDGPDVMAPGFRVGIHAVFADQDLRTAQMVSTLERGWKLNGYRMTKSIGAKTVAQAAAARATMVVGRKNAARHLFKLLDSAHPCADAPSTPINESWFASGSRAAILLPSGLKRCSHEALFPTTEIILNGLPCPAPAQSGALVESAYGKQWRAKVDKRSAPSRKTMKSARVPYSDLEAALGEAGISTEEMFTLMKRIRLGMLPLANDLRIRNRAMAIAQRSYDRKLWHDRLAGQKEPIEALVAQGNWDALAELLDDFLSDVSRYLSKGLSLCPGKDCLDMACLLLEHKGEDKQAEKLRKLAPEQHLAPLE